MTMEDALMRAIVNAGVGGLISVLIILLMYRLSLSVGVKIVHAFESQSEALTRQAGSIEGLTTSIRDFVGRDNSEHREIIILMKVLSEKIESIHNGS